LANSSRYAPQRLIWKHQGMFANSMQVAAVAFPSSAGTSGGNHQVHCYFTPFILPGPGRILGVTFHVANQLTVNKFYPKLKFQFYSHDATYGGPRSVIDNNYTPDVLGTGSTTSYTYANNTNNDGTDGNYRRVEFQFTSYPIIPFTQADLRIWVGIMTQKAYTDDTGVDNAISAINVYSNQEKWKSNNASPALCNPAEFEFLTGMGTNITTQAWPTNVCDSAAAAISNTPATTPAGLGIGLIYQLMDV